MPAFSIITATYNAEKTIRRLLDSLATQTSRDFNVIIQDGNSTDDTLIIAKSYYEKIPNILIQSVHDNGIYDAWNRALDRAGDKLGQWVLFLGADDALASDTVLEDVACKICNIRKSVLFLYGRVVYVNGDDIGNEHEEFELHVMFDNLWNAMSVQNSGLFYNHRLFEYNRFDASFKIAGDYDFFVRNWRSLDELIKIDVLVTKFALGGCSSDYSQARILLEENFKITKQYFPEKYNKLIYFRRRLKIAYLCQKHYLRCHLQQFCFGRALLCWYKKMKQLLYIK